jgi:hypothetical protein
LTDRINTCIEAREFRVAIEHIRLWLTGNGPKLQRSVSEMR